MRDGFAEEGSGHMSVRVLEERNKTNQIRSDEARERNRKKEAYLLSQCISSTLPSLAHTRPLFLNPIPSSNTSAEQAFPESSEDSSAG
jgi:hypothetical protein